MTLLIILLALMIGWLAGRQLRDLKHLLIHTWFARLMGRSGHPLRPVVLTLLPGLAVAVLHLYLLQLGQLFTGALISLAALVFAWGSRDLDADVQHYLEADDPKERRDAACMLLMNYREAASVSDDEKAEVLVEGVFYQALARWFGALFWFLIAGPGGAVMFRFLHALLAEERNVALLSEQQVRSGQRWLSIVDWPAALLASLGLAMVGDFDRVVSGSRQLVAETGWQTFARDVWPKTGAMIVRVAPDDAFDHDFSGAPGRVNIAMNLVWRVLVCWLTVAAVATVVMVLN